MGTLTTIPHNKLRLCPENIRRSSVGVAAERELKASIASHGILMNLIVTKEPRGLYKVRAGARRFSASSQLIAENALPKDYLVPCYILDKTENPEEAALIENTLREAMHPVDEFESYHRLHFIEQLPIESIAGRFGKSTIDVKKRLSLGGVAPELRELCRAGELSIDSLSAFTLSDDHTEQLECYHALNNGHNLYAQAIRENLTQRGYKSNHKLVQFVGIDAYTAAGGTITSDLFNDISYLHSADLIEQLVTEKFEAESEKLVDAGWKWADVNLNFYNAPIKFPLRLSPEFTAEPVALQEALIVLEKRHTAAYVRMEDLDEKAADYEEAEKVLLNELDALEDEISNKEEEIETAIEQGSSFSKKQMAYAGCVLTLNYKGELFIERGFVKKDEIAEIDVKAPSNAGDDDNDSDSSEDDPGVPQPLKIEYSQALTSDLIAAHLAAVQIDLAYSSDIAYGLMMFSIAWASLTNAGFLAPLAISITETAKGSLDFRANQAFEELNGLRKKLNLDWLHTDDEVNSFIEFRALDEKSKQKIVGWCAARSLNPRRSVYQSVEILDHVMELCQTRVAKYWRPTQENFYNRINVPTALAVGAELYDNEDFAYDHRGKAKRDLVILLDEKTEAAPIDECWIPQLMRSRVI